MSKEGLTRGNDEGKTLTEQDLVTLTRQKAARYLAVEGVTSVGVAYRRKRDESTGETTTTDELCIQFTVGQKLAPEALEEKGIARLPDWISVDGEGNKQVRVQVVERSFKPSYRVVSNPLGKAVDAELTPHAKRCTRLDPVIPGISVSHERGTAGTIGAIVYDKTGVPYLLSNWHVLAGEDGQVGDNIVQPGPYDNDDLAANRVGHLARSHLGLAGDCAIATIENRRFSENILQLDVVPSRAAKADLGDRIRKSGRTTGVTHGIVSRVGVVAKIDYRGKVGVQEIGGFEVRSNPAKLPTSGEISMGGDSGSVWLVDNKNGADIVVGLHFAGETDPHPDAEHALACNIHSVLEKLEVSFVDTASPEVDEEELWNESFERLRQLEMRVGTLERAGETPRQGSRDTAPAPTTTPEGVPVYGNWCGPWHGGGKPIDDLDRACMRHDKCYERRGRHDCSCDAELLGHIDQALSSGNVKGLGYVMGP